MDDETKKMINELEKRGYKVIKISKTMEKDMEECEEMDLEGKSKECLGCSCSICLMQIY